MSNQQVWQNRAPAAPSQGFIARHWRGELSLGKSLLVGFAAAVFPGPMIIVPLAAMLDSVAPHSSVMMQVAVVYLPPAVLSLWGAIGLMRAGWRYRHAPKFMQRSTGLGFVAVSILMIVGVVGGLFAFIGEAADHNSPTPHHHAARR